MAAAGIVLVGRLWWSDAQRLVDWCAALVLSALSAGGAMNIADISKEELRAVATNARALALDASQRIWPDGVWGERVSSVEQFMADVLVRLCLDAALRDFQFGRNSDERSRREDTAA